MDDAFKRAGLSPDAFPPAPSRMLVPRKRRSVGDPVPAEHTTQRIIQPAPPAAAPPAAASDPLSERARVRGARFEAELAGVRAISAHADRVRVVVCVDCGQPIERLRLPAPPKPVLCLPCRNVRRREANQMWRDHRVEWDLHSPTWPPAPPVVDNTPGLLAEREELVQHRSVKLRHCADIQAEVAALHVQVFDLARSFDALYAEALAAEDRIAEIDAALG